MTKDISKAGYSQHITFLSLGTNIGDRELNMRRAISLIGERIGRVERQSTFITTEPWGFESENQFLNAAVKVQTNLSPTDLLYTTQQIERDMGRTVKSKDGIYHDRVIDIDILLYDNLQVNTDELTIPHPLMNEREFVMKPLREIL